MRMLMIVRNNLGQNAEFYSRQAAGYCCSWQPRLRPRWANPLFEDMPPSPNRRQPDLSTHTPPPRRAATGARDDAVLEPHWEGLSDHHLTTV